MAEVVVKFVKNCIGPAASVPGRDSAPEPVRVCQCYFGIHTRTNDKSFSTSNGLAM